MAGGKGKSTGGKAGPKETTGKSQTSHSAKAGLQVYYHSLLPTSSSDITCDHVMGRLALARQQRHDDTTRITYYTIGRSFGQTIVNTNIFLSHYTSNISYLVIFPSEGSYVPWRTCTTTSSSTHVSYSLSIQKPNTLSSVVSLRSGQTVPTQ